MASRGRASEELAARILEERGFEVVGRGKRIRLGGVDVGEVDIVARGPDGSLYAVEVKAGPLDVNGVRQAYVNAQLLGAKPMVVCKGFADEAARALAERLGVEVLVLSDLFLADPEELAELVESSVWSAMLQVLEVLLASPRPYPRELEVLRALAEAPTALDAAQRLGVSVEELGRLLAELRRRGLLPKTRSYQQLRSLAKIIVAREELLSRITEALSARGAGGGSR